MANEDMKQRNGQAGEGVQRQRLPEKAGAVERAGTGRSRRRRRRPASGRDRSASNEVQPRQENYPTTRSENPQENRSGNRQTAERQPASGRAEGIRNRQSGRRNASRPSAAGDNRGDPRGNRRFGERRGPGGDGRRQEETEQNGGRTAQAGETRRQVLRDGAQNRSRAGRGLRDKDLVNAETFQDIRRDNDRIEKEIWLEIADIHTVKLD